MAKKDFIPHPDSEFLLHHKPAYHRSRRSRHHCPTG